MYIPEEIRPISVSIIIPTFQHSGRSENLRTLLVSLEREISGRNEYEIIVVDNGNSLKQDELSIIKDILLSENHISVAQEPSIGLSRAKNRGIQAARGDILIFLDDDIVPVTGWLDSLIMGYQSSDTLCVGGPIIVNDQGLQFPRWFSEYFFRFVAPRSFQRSLA